MTGRRDGGKPTRCRERDRTVTTKTPRFTIGHGYAVSVALHALLLLPFVHGLVMVSDDAPILVVDLQGLEADTQVDARASADAAAAPTPPSETALQAAETPPVPPPPEPPPDPPEDVVTEPEPPPPQGPLTPPTPEIAADNGQVRSAEGQQAQTIRRNRDETQRLDAYVKLLSKKIRSNLMYPEDGRRAGLQGRPTVSFTVAPDGTIRPDTLKITESSGQPKLDASALKTIRSVVPFPPPPREIAVTLVVDFGRIARQ